MSASTKPPRQYCPMNGHDITDLSGQEIFDHILLENGEIPR